jgi:hypothetical protein
LVDKGLKGRGFSRAVRDPKSPKGSKKRSRALALEEAAMRLVDSITSLGPLLIPIIAIVVGGAIAITTMILRHNERIAKIERGIDPDAGQPRN